MVGEIIFIKSIFRFFHIIKIKSFYIPGQVIVEKCKFLIINKKKIIKSILKRAAEKDRQREKSEEEAIKAEIANPETSESRRNFLKKIAIGGIALGGGMLSIEDTVAQTTQKVQRSSSPTDLKITRVPQSALSLRRVSGLACVFAKS